MKRYGKTKTNPEFHGQKHMEIRIHSTRVLLAQFEYGSLKGTA